MMTLLFPNPRPLLRRLLNKQWWLPHLLLLLAIALLLVRPNIPSLTMDEFTTRPVYDMTLETSFDADGDVSVSTYLPIDTQRQAVMEERYQDVGMEKTTRLDSRGRYLNWQGDESGSTIVYQARLSLSAVRYDISPDIVIPSRYDADFADYLAATDAIPLNHPEITALWDSLKPADPTNALAVVNAIYQYVLALENKPFKGFTDALTALRLEAASCNGKSRLFASLARLNNIPARLVGGVILDGRRKKTSHQWIEIYLAGHWIPFDTVNDHFASLPENYVQLYLGDQVLFKRTSNINFDYRFDSVKDNIPQVMLQQPDAVSTLVVSLLERLGLTQKSAAIFLLIPLCSLIIAFLRNVVGIKTFGTFMPALIAAVCVYAGLWYGLASFSLILLLAFVGHAVLERLHILKIPRLAAIMTLISMVTLLLTYYQGEQFAVKTGMLALFPAVIITFTADRISDMSSNHDLSGILKNSAGTLLTIFLCYYIFQSVVLKTAFILYPELLVLVLAGLIYIGAWGGIRVSELLRFRRLLHWTERRVLGMNRRNRELVYKSNDKALLRQAADKLATKTALAAADIPHPRTLGICRAQAEVTDFVTTMQQVKSCALKPNCGSRGNGILIIRDYQDRVFRGSGGQSFTLANIRKHVNDILIGNYSQTGEEDSAYIETLITQHEFFNQLSEHGLSDIRIILHEGKLISAMARVPTADSKGKANLHQGAIGIAIDLTTGRLQNALVEGKNVRSLPGIEDLTSLTVPQWSRLCFFAKRCYEAIPLGYMGVDLCLDHHDGPLVLEVNGQPGLEIQNVQSAPLALTGV